MNMIWEPSKNIPVIEDCDICVLGGSCTGLFAAVRAARLGARVVIVEKQNCFGGVATSGMVNIWHSLYNTTFEKQIIAGLTHEVIERLMKRKAVSLEKDNKTSYYSLNTEELKIELDELAAESKIKPYLHTLYTAPYLEDGELKAVFVESKSGRGAIKAKVFIDATGDGDLCSHLGLDVSVPETKQPPTTCVRLSGISNLKKSEYDRLLNEHRKEFNLPEGFMWSSSIPGLPETVQYAATRVNNANCLDACSLTYSEMEARRQVRAIMDIIRKYGPEDSRDVSLAALPSYIGVRETRHVKCLYTLTEKDILTGRRFEDAIANGTYRIDIHHNDKPGLTFKYLDGTEIYIRDGYPSVPGRWREEQPENPTFYQIPFRSIVPGKYKNILLCGRSLDADKGAFGAVRVMVNLNQTGEAAGTAAYLALDSGRGVDRIDIRKLRGTLTKGGSIII